MTHLLVSGLINLETDLQIEGFPLPYYPVRYPFFGVTSGVSGVGYNLAKAFTVLGDAVRFLSLIGQDAVGRLVRQALAEAGIADTYVLPRLAETPQSVILYDSNGRRQIHVDLKTAQEQRYPAEQFEQARVGCALAVLCNVNFSRPLLALARQAGLPIATDVHAIHDLEDAYNRDFMAAAQILFMSDEQLPCSPEEGARQLLNRYGAEIIVIGLGAQGALLAVRRDHFLERLPAWSPPQPVVNTIGAGDALFAAFLHFYWPTADPYAALRKAQCFAACKIGARHAAEGFSDEATVNALVAAPPAG